MFQVRIVFHTWKSNSLAIKPMVFQVRLVSRTWKSGTPIEQLFYRTENVRENTFVCTEFTEARHWYRKHTSGVPILTKKQLFSPLAQENILRLLKDRQVGYGDDFDFYKNKMRRLRKRSKKSTRNILRLSISVSRHFFAYRCTSK